MVYAWHFTGKRLRDGRPIPKPLAWLEHTGPIVWCQSGLHASEKPYDALSYFALQLNRTAILHLVECDEVEDRSQHKLVCRRRRILASMGASEMLYYYARMRALALIDRWQPPDVVSDYLMSGDVRLRGMARAEAARVVRASGTEDLKFAAAAAAYEAADSSPAEAAYYTGTRSGRNCAAKAADLEFNALVYECFEGPLKQIGWRPQLSVRP